MAIPNTFNTATPWQGAAKKVLIMAAAVIIAWFIADFTKWIPAGGDRTVSYEEISKAISSFGMRPVSTPGYLYVILGLRVGAICAAVSAIFYFIRIYPLFITGGALTLVSTGVVAFTLLGAMVKNGNLGSADIVLMMICIILAIVMIIQAIKMSITEMKTGVIQQTQSSSLMTNNFQLEFAVSPLLAYIPVVSAIWAWTMWAKLQSDANMQKAKYALIGVALAPFLLFIQTGTGGIVFFGLVLTAAALQWFYYCYFVGTGRADGAMKYGVIMGAITAAFLLILFVFRVLSTSIVTVIPSQFLLLAATLYTVPAAIMVFIAKKFYNKANGL